MIPLKTPNSLNEPALKISQLMVEPFHFSHSCFPFLLILKYSQSTHTHTINTRAYFCQVISANFVHFSYKSDNILVEFIQLEVSFYGNPLGNRHKNRSSFDLPTQTYVYEYKHSKGGKKTAPPQFHQDEPVSL